MKLKLWTEDSRNEVNDEQLFLKLETCSHQDIHLSCVDKHGIKIQDGHILSLDQDIKCLIIVNGISDRVPLNQILIMN